LTDYKNNRGKLDFSNISFFELLNNSCNHKKQVYIIDCYRTPIERKISSFFHNISIHLPNYKNLTLVEIMNNFNNKFLYHLEEIHSVNEVMNNYDIPLIKEFDFDKRYRIVKKDNKVFIKLLFKDIKKWDIILSEIFGKRIKMHDANLTETKEINKLYKEFKEMYRVPKDYLIHLLLKDKEFLIYNKKEEIEEYINNWLAKSY